MALVVKIGADLRNFDREMKKLTRDVNTVGNKLKGAGKALTAGVTLPIAAMGAASIKVGMDFESSMSKVAAVSGATGDDLEALTAKAREVGAATQFSASEAADALNYMALAGWDTQQMLDGIDGVMALAAASGEDLAQVSDIVTDGLSAFGMKAEESARFADVLAAASANANTDVAGLGAAFEYVAPVAGALGFTIEDTAKAIGIMSNAGIKGQKAGTALRTMMTNLAKPTDQMKSAMDELGISLTDSEGNMKTFDTIMNELRVSFADLTEAEQASAAATIFGKEAMSGALAIINASAEDYDKLTEAINNSEGAAQDMADVMTDNLGGRIKEMQSAFEEMGITIYNNLKPALEGIVAAVQSLADWFNDLSPSTQNLIVGLAALAAAVGPILLAVGTAIILFGQLSAALTILGISMAAAFWWMLAIIAALAAIVAVIVYWDEIKAFFIAFWAYMKNLFSTAWDYIKDKTMAVWQAIWSFISPFVTKIAAFFSVTWNAIKTATTAVWNYIKQYLTALWTVLKMLVTPIFERIKSVITEKWNMIRNTTTVVWNALKATVTTIWNSIKSTAQTVWNALKSVIMTPVNYIKTQVGSAFDGMKNTALRAWEGLRSGMRTVINGIIRLVNRFISGFNTPAKILNKIPGVDAPIIPNIPMLATGGNLFGSGMAIVGEAGPELVQKSGSSVKVTPLSAQEKARGISGLTGNISLEIPLYLNGREIAYASIDDLNKLMDRRTLQTNRARGMI